MPESTDDRGAGAGRERGSVSDPPDVDDVREWLEKVGDARPPIEPDLHAIVDRAGQRVFRRRIGTGLALLGLIVPGVALAPTVANGFNAKATETTVIGELEPIGFGDASGGVLVSMSECLAEVGRFRANFGTCRYL